LEKQRSKVPAEVPAKIERCTTVSSQRRNWPSAA